MECFRKTQLLPPKLIVCGATIKCKIRFSHLHIRFLDTNQTRLEEKIEQIKVAPTVIHVCFNAINLLDTKNGNA